MNNKNRFSVVFGSNLGIIASIFIFGIMGLKLINGIISAILNGAAGILGLVPTIFGVGFTSVIAIGFLLSYLSGKKEEISPAGLMCIRIMVMISGISSFVIFTIVGMILLVGTIVGGVSISYFDGGATALYVILMILFLIVIVGIAVIHLMYALKVNKLLSTIRWYEKSKEPIKVGFIKFVMVLNIVSGAWGIISGIIGMIMPMFFLDILDEFDEMGEILGSIFGISGSSIITGIINIIISGVSIALYIIIFMMLGQAKYIDTVQNRENEKDFEQDEEEDDDDVQGTDVLEEPPVINVEQEIPVSPIEIPDTNKKGTIIALSGKEAGYSYPLNDGEELIIGKDAKVAHIIVGSQYDLVSRKHCGIKYDAASDKYQVIDYSTNGTYINSITRGRLTKGIYVTVPKGTVINLGKETLDFKLD